MGFPIYVWERCFFVSFYNDGQVNNSKKWYVMVNTPPHLCRTSNRTDADGFIFFQFLYHFYHHFGWQFYLLGWIFIFAIIIVNLSSLSSSLKKNSNIILASLLLNCSRDMQLREVGGNTDPQKQETPNQFRLPYSTFFPHSWFQSTSKLRTKLMDLHQNGGLKSQDILRNEVVNTPPHQPTGFEHPERPLLFRQKTFIARREIHLL